MERLRFAILGPLRAWHADRELDLGPGKQRAVLTVLLLHAGRPVQTNRIIDAVWAEEPPANGPNVVQKYVAGLRRVLEPDRSPRTPGQVLSLTDAGYLLRVGPDDVDALRFERWSREASVAREAGRWQEAAVELRSALDLWRGEPFPGLTGPFFDSSRHRLVEMRAAALEVWAELELHLGRHHELVGELARLVAEFPVRERMRGLLMLALYRDGRQAEALNTFREVRALLRDEHGLEPGEQLQELHRRILRSDPTLVVPNTAVSGEIVDGPPVVSAAGENPTAGATTQPSAPVETAVEPVPVETAVEPVPVETAVEPVPVGEVPVRSGPGPAPAVLLPPLPPALLPIAPAPVAGRSAGPRWVSILGTVLGALGVLLSFGLFTWLVIFVYAWRRRSRWLVAAGLGYLAVVIGFVVGMESGNPDPAVPASTGQSFGIFGQFLVSWLGGILHVVLLNRSVQGVLGRGRRPATSAVQRGGAERRVRREHARYLLYHYPTARTELRIGRPDLPHSFDDGGLVDINTVAEHVVLGLPGLSPEQSRHILLDRWLRGPYASMEELVARCLLPMEVADSLREVLVFLPPPAQPAAPGWVDSARSTPSQPA